MWWSSKEALVTELGIRAGLKHRCPLRHAGSIPVEGTSLCKTNDATYGNDAF